MTREEYEVKKKEIEDAADVKSAELTIKLGRKVYPFCFFNEDKFIVGYIKEPARLDKMRSIDLYEQSRTQAGDLILRTSLVHEESDKAILDEKEENDPIYLGAISFAVSLVQIAAEQLKKKNY